jgi:hypothetical protein
LKNFGWSIIIDYAQWGQWMAYITTYHSTLARYQAISRDYGVVAVVIDRVNRHDPHWYCDCESKSIFNDLQYAFSAKHLDGTDADSSSPSPTYPRCLFGSHSPLSPLPSLCYPPRRRKPKVDLTIYRPTQATANVVSSVEQQPASWCPAVDPIVAPARPVRTICIAPGTTWIKPVTVLDILEDITKGRYPPLPHISQS